ncbi:hypothetical protein Lal_00002318 [Lupinus albus]|nr:hypothetical protein Lal_00002318 [Lupinus albus]
MFKKFSSEEVSAQNQVKASVQRKIRQSIAEEYPGLEPVMDDILPKKSPLIVAKCQNHLNLVIVNNVPLFFSVRDGPYMPTLRLLHQYPDIMKKLQVDRGAIRFVLAGANIMCPGLTSPGGALDEEVEAESPVAIIAEGKQHALAIGFTKMSAKDILQSANSSPIMVFGCWDKQKQSTRELGSITCIISMMVFGRWRNLIEDVSGAAMQINDW